MYGWLLILIVNCTPFPVCVRVFRGIRPCHKAAILPGGPKKLCFTTLSLVPMVSIARLSVVKQSSFGLPGQYGRRVTRVNTFLLVGLVGAVFTTFIVGSPDHTTTSGIFLNMLGMKNRE